MCDEDDDGDDVRDTSDNCLGVFNPLVEPRLVQPDADGDGLGDACDPPPPPTDDDVGISPNAPAPTPSAAPRAPGIVDRQAPRITLSVRTALRFREAEDGLVVRLRCSEACAVKAQLVAVRGRAGTVRRTAVVARGTAAVETAATTFAFVRFEHAARARLWRLRRTRLTLKVTVTDPAGNVRRVTERLTLAR
jgi:hypothetical protein